MNVDGDIEIDNDGELVSVVVSVARRFDSLRSNEFAVELASRIKQRVPRDRRVPPSVAVAGRVLDVARWHDDHDPVYEMFAELLAKACDREQYHSANPAFAEIVRQLSPDEARLLYWIASRPVTLYEAKWFKTTEHMQLNFAEHGTQITSYEFPYWRLGNPDALTSGAYIGHLGAANGRFDRVALGNGSPGIDKPWRGVIYLGCGRGTNCARQVAAAEADHG